METTAYAVILPLITYLLSIEGGDCQLFLLLYTNIMII